MLFFLLKKNLDFYATMCHALLVTNRALRKMKARWFNNHVCKNEEKLLERLDQAILDLIDNPAKTQQTTAIARYFDKRSRHLPSYKILC